MTCVLSTRRVEDAFLPEGQSRASGRGWLRRPDLAPVTRASFCLLMEAWLGVTQTAP